MKIVYDNHTHDKYCQLLWFANRPHLGSDLSEEEEGLSSNEEDDNSSTSSKDEMDHTQDKEVRPGSITVRYYTTQPQVVKCETEIITVSDYSE